MAGIISCRALGKTYGRLQAISDLDLEIGAGATVGLVGPNGAGKSTLFALLCGFIHPDRGSMEIFGLPPRAALLKGRIGILPQDVPFSRGISVEKQLALFARLQGLGKTAAAAEVGRVLELTRAQDLARQLPEALSHGQRKKVLFAQALLGAPEILLLDEPTAGLDPVAAALVRQVIQQINSVHTCIISSHNLDEIKSVCHEVVILDHGKLVQHCRIDDLLGRDNSLSILLEQPATADLLQALQADPAIVSVRCETADERRLDIVFRHDSPQEFQRQLLSRLDQLGAGVLEFSRGSGFSDKVMELVGRQ